jgi:hypothetical protein
MLPTKFHFILSEGFQRRRLKCEKLTDDRQRTPSDGKSSHCLWQGELMSFILSDGWKISAIMKFSIKKIPGCMTYVVHPDLFRLIIYQHPWK